MFNFKTKKNKAHTPNLYKKANLVLGFTLVETMVAVFILSLTIISLMTVVANSLFTSRYSRDEITVNYLLQEAVDYIRNDRDGMIFLSDGNMDDNWKSFIEKYKNCSNKGGCYFDVYTNLQDPSNFNPTECGDSGSEEITICPIFYFNLDPRFYFYNYQSEGVETSFQREIVVRPDPINTNEILVEAKVFWKNGDISKLRSLKTSLLKW